MILKTAPILGKEGMNSALLIKGWLRSVLRNLVSLNNNLDGQLSKNR